MFGDRVVFDHEVVPVYWDPFAKDWRRKGDYLLDSAPLGPDGVPGLPLARKPPSIFTDRGLYRLMRRFETEETRRGVVVGETMRRDGSITDIDEGYRTFIPANSYPIVQVAVDTSAGALVLDVWGPDLALDLETMSLTSA